MQVVYHFVEGAGTVFTGSWSYPSESKGQLHLDTNYQHIYSSYLEQTSLSNISAILYKLLVIIIILWDAYPFVKELRSTGQVEGKSHVVCAIVRVWSRKRGRGMWRRKERERKKRRDINKPYSRFHKQSRFGAGDWLRRQWQEILESRDCLRRQSQRNKNTWLLCWNTNKAMMTLTRTLENWAEPPLQYHFWVSIANHGETFHFKVTSDFRTARQRMTGF